MATAFDLEASGQYLGVEMNGIIMDTGGAQNHAMALIGKRGWRYLVPTDGVKFDNGQRDVYGLSGHSMGPMLLFQEGRGDSSVDPRGGVTLVRPENNRVMAAPNPGGMMWAFDTGGNRLAFIPGKKLTFTQAPVTDFAALRRELAAAQGGNR